MKIIGITEDYIEFDNGNRITYSHDQDCCEQNYADFSQLDDIATITDFDENLHFEFVNKFGFRFGNLPNKMFFVPCYSFQNGYYSDEITIHYNDVEMLSFSCEFVKCEC